MEIPVPYQILEGLESCEVTSDNDEFFKENFRKKRISIKQTVFYFKLTGVCWFLWISVENVTNLFQAEAGLFNWNSVEIAELKSTRRASISSYIDSYMAI